MKAVDKIAFSESYKKAYPYWKEIHKKVSPELLYDRIVSLGFKILADKQSEAKP